MLNRILFPSIVAILAYGLWLSSSVTDIAAGVALAAVAIGGNALIYAQLNNAEPVVQVVRDVPAGQQVTSC